MKKIGLTGGIGSGKSTVAGFMTELGAVVIDADKIGHEAFESGTELWHEVVAAFGKEILALTGEIDREKLGETVFGNPDSLARLNRIMHPAMYDMVKGQIEEYRRQGVDVVVLEAPLLLEAGWTSLVDEVWVAVASEPTVLGRLQEKSGLSEQQALARIHSQLSSEERIEQAGVVIYTDCDLEELEIRVKRLWKRRVLDTLL